MAGGPIGPNSVYLGAASGNLFPSFYVGAGGNASPADEGIGVVASLASTSVAQLRFPMPPSIPTGTLKLMVRCLANAATGNALFTVSDGACGNGASPSAVSLTAEAQSTVTWSSTGDVDKYKDTKVTLSTTPTANDSLVVALTFNSTGGWTLAQTLTAITWVLWE